MEFPGKALWSAGSHRGRPECEDSTIAAAPGQAAAVAGRLIETRYMPVLRLAQRGIRHGQIPIRGANVCKGQTGKPEGQALTHRLQYRLLGAPQSDEGMIACLRIERRENVGFPGVEKAPGDFDRAQIFTQPLDVYAHCSAPRHRDQGVVTAV